MEKEIREKIEDYIFKLRQYNSEWMQDLADELEEIINESEV